jgi:hypothetical protein
MISSRMHQQEYPYDNKTAADEKVIKDNYSKMTRLKYFSIRIR